MQRGRQDTGGFLRTRRGGIVISLFVYLVSFGALNLLFWMSTLNDKYLCR